MQTGGFSLARLAPGYPVKSGCPVATLRSTELVTVPSGKTPAVPENGCYVTYEPERLKSRLLNQGGQRSWVAREKLPTQRVRLPPQRAPHLGQVLFSVVNNERLDHLGHCHFALLGGDASFSALGGGELPDHARRRPNFLV